ncbi:unnamed protein product [Urochloa humidicola]
MGGLSGSRHGLALLLRHALVHRRRGRQAFGIKPCGVAYWLITVDQAMSPVSNKLDALPAYVFPVAALLTGVLSGVFGIRDNSK